jgi:hypothetical protein
VFVLTIGREDAESRSNSAGVHPSDSRAVAARGEIGSAFTLRGHGPSSCRASRCRVTICEMAMNAASEASPAASPKPSSSISTGSSDVLSAQQRLKDRGYYRGPSTA